MRKLDDIEINIVCIMHGKWGVQKMCVGCLDFASFRGFLLAVGTVPTVANALFVCLFCFFWH